MNKQPEISVLMPMYNAEQYVLEAVNSILNQSFIDFEFIIIDDCSTDRTFEIVKNIEDDRIRLFRNDENLKISATLNKGLDLAKGKYLARMDADDISRPNRLEIQYQYLESNPHIDMCGGDIQCFGVYRFINARPSEYSELKDYSLYGTSMCHPTFMAREKVYRTMRYNEAYAGAEDFLLFSDLMQEYIGVNIPQVLLDYRLSGNQSSFYLDDTNTLKTHTHQIDLTFEIFKINLNRIYDASKYNGDIELMEDYFIGKKILPDIAYNAFSEYYSFIIQSNTKKVYSNDVIKMIYTRRLMDSFKHNFKTNGTSGLTKSLFAFYQHTDNLRFIITKNILLAIQSRIFSR